MMRDKLQLSVSDPLGAANKPTGTEWLLTSLIHEYHGVSKDSIGASSGLILGTTAYWSDLPGLQTNRFHKTVLSIEKGMNLQYGLPPDSRDSASCVP